MANQVISMQQIRALLQLLEKGFSLRTISEQLRLSRPTVTLYAIRFKASTIPLEALRHLSDADLAAIVYAPAIQADCTDDTRRRDLVTRIPYFLSELKRTGVTRLLL